ncbi:MAG: hypothetical protein ACYDAY_07765 [Candidatus Dormibacteria bacterium]
MTLVVAVPGGGRRLWCSQGAVTVIAKDGDSLRLHRLEGEALLNLGPWPRYATDLVSGPGRLLGYRGRSLTLSRPASNEVTVVDEGGRVVTRAMPAGVLSAAWNSSGPVVGLDDGRVLQLSVQLAVQAEALPHGEHRWPMTAAVGASREAEKTWAASNATVVRLGAGLEPELMHDAPVAPLHTREILCSADGLRAFCRSELGSALLHDAGRALTEVGASHAVVDEGGDPVALSDFNWVSLYGHVIETGPRGSKTADGVLPHRLFLMRDGSVIGISGPVLRWWAGGSLRPVLQAEATFSRTVRDVAECDDGLLVMATDLFRIRREDQ